MSMALEDMVAGIQKLMQAQEQKSAEISALIQEMEKEKIEVKQGEGTEGGTLPTGE